MYHYIFFDLDGTLTDFKEGILNCLRYAFEKLGEPTPPDSTLIKFIGPPLQDSFMRFCGFDEAKAILQKNRIEKLPIVDKDYKLKGLITIKDIEKVMKYPNSAKDEHGRLLCAAAIGVTADVLDRAGALIDAGVDVLVLDSAHGHSANIMRSVRLVKEKFPDIQLVAGNVATAEATEALIKAGADCVKVGIGPGSICTTRVVCGVGIPQLTAVYSAAKALRGTGVAVIADGGIKLSGDVPKAIAAGADSVMLGSVLAGTDESPGEKIYANGRQYVVYRGMGSMAALKNGKGSRARYFQDGEAEEDLVPQGIEGMVPYCGKVKSIMTQFCGGLKASLGYCGSRTIAELQDKGRFYRVTAAGQREARPHDITITKEAPNYRA